MKSTIQILLIVTLVFFGLTFLTKGCQNKTNDGEKSEQTTALADEQTAPANRIDSISPNEDVIIRAAEYIRAAGAPDAASGIVAYNYQNVNLTLSADTLIAGTVTVDQVEIPFADVVASRFPEGLSIAQKSQAAFSLRKALEFAARNGRFARSLTAETQSAPVTLENDQIILEFSNRGGYISQATLKNYFTYFESKSNPDSIDKQPVRMYRPEYRNTVYYGYTLRTLDQQEINTVDLNFSPRKVSDNVVEMAIDFGNDSRWGYRYTLNQGEDGLSFLVNVEVFQENMADILSPSMNAPIFQWHNLMPRQDKSRTFENRNSSVYYKYVGDSPEDLGMESDREDLNHNIRWVAFKNQFFSTVIVPSLPFNGGSIAQASFKDDNLEYVDFVKDMDATLGANYDSSQPVAASFAMYIGPNDYNFYSNLDDKIIPDADDLDLTRLVPLGWSWLRWINTLIIIPIFTFLSGFISNYGIIILILTIIIKIILFPFTYKSYLSQAKMRLLAPEIKEINEKYPGQENAMVRNQKTMALYSRAGASPMSGCLPLLLQMPILIAMFSFFPSCIELRGESFLWAKDLAAPDVILTLPFSIPFYGSHVSLFCLLMTVTNIIYTQINMKSQPTSSSMPGMKWMMYLMPLMFLFFFNDYASALSYYYFLSLLITIVQTWVFRRCVSEDKLRRKMAENAAKPKKKSGLMARLEEAQRKQQALLREQQKQNNKRRR